METVVYTTGAPGNPLDVFWQDIDDTLFNLSTGYTFALTCGVYGQAISFTKTTGMVGAVGDFVNDVPNLVVNWSTTPNTELTSLTPGRYVLHFVAVPMGGIPIELYGELIVRQNAPNYGYCEFPDLQLGGLTLPTRFNPYDAINSAADEMNAKLGQVYELPLDLTAAPSYVTPMLRKINAQLASGRILCAYSENEDKNVHAYGAQLIKEAKDELLAIFDGRQQLIDVPKLPGSFKVTAPEIFNHDQRSAVDSYEDFAHRYDGDEVWHPGGLFGYPAWNN